MPRMATQDEFEEYKDGGLCPYCYAEDVVVDAVSWEGKTVERKMYCDKCELRWTEKYEMTGLYLDDGE